VKSMGIARFVRFSHEQHGLNSVSFTFDSCTGRGHTRTMDCVSMFALGHEGGVFRGSYLPCRVER
jgi:hypothetical protein